MCTQTRPRTVDPKEDDMAERGIGMLGLVAGIAIGVVVGGLALSAVFWAFGLLLHLVFWVVRLALVIGLAAAVFWLVERRRSGRVLS
jgi:hypothetical protein